MATEMKLDTATCKTIQINWSQEKIDETTSITSCPNTNLQLTYTIAIFFALRYVYVPQGGAVEVIINVL